MTVFNLCMEKNSR